MKALIFIADGVEDLEFFYPYYRFQEEGFSVDVAGPKVGNVQGKHGYSFPIKLTFSDVSASHYDILVIAGGKAPETVRLNPDAIKITQEMFKSGKIVAAVCHGFQVIISAGLAKGKTATCWQGIKDDLKAAGAHYEDKEVVVDGNLITSRKPDDLPAFCREILSSIKALV